MDRTQQRTVHLFLTAVAFPCALLASDGDAGPDQYICATQTVLSASALTQGETGTWSVVSGTAIISPANSPATIVSGLANGENVLQWTVLLNGFPSSTDQLTITVYDPSAMPAAAGPDISVCLEEPVATMLASQPPYPLLGSWSVVSGTATIASPTQAQSVVTCSGLGQVSLRWTVYNGPCGESSDDVVITVENCQTGVEDLGANAPQLRFDPLAEQVHVTGASPASIMQLVDAVGRLIGSATTDLQGRASLSVAGEPAGWYAVRSSGGDHHQTLRFLLAR